MRKGHWLALAVLLGGVILLLAWTSPTQSQVLPPPKKLTLEERLAVKWKVPANRVREMLADLGPELTAELAEGKQINLSGFGTFRVVRTPEHRDMIVGGRQGGTPIVVPGNNSVEFIPEGRVNSAANAPTAVPADVVPPFQYIPLPGQTPGQKTGRTRVPTNRVP